MNGPQVLVDVPDEPIEQFGHVEKTAEIDTPEKAVAYMLADDALFDPSGYDVPSTLVPAGEARFRCRNPEASYEEQRWDPAEPDDDHGIDFWRLEVVDAEDVAA